MAAAGTPGSAGGRSKSGEMATAAGLSVVAAGLVWAVTGALWRSVEKESRVFDALVRGVDA